MHTKKAQRCTICIMSLRQSTCQLFCELIPNTFWLRQNFRKCLLWSFTRNQEVSHEIALTTAMYSRNSCKTSGRYFKLVAGISVDFSEKCIYTYRTEVNTLFSQRISLFIQKLFYFPSSLLHRTIQNHATQRRQFVDFSKTHTHWNKHIKQTTMCLQQ